MQFVIKLFPEINLKSHSIQRRLTAILQSNLHQILSRFDPGVVVKREWDKIVVTSGPHSCATSAQYVQALVCVPGLQYILEVEVQPFQTLDDILQHTQAIWGRQLAGKTFCVRVRRNGQHDFTSLQVQQFVGAGLHDNYPNAGVDLRQPDVLIQLEVVGQTLYLVRATHHGLGGYPLATQDDVLSMLSGGFDSAVASFQFIKRGCRVHYCFFNLGGAEHLRGVQQMAYLLWSKYASTHNAQLIAVDFAAVMSDIVQHIPQGNQGVVLKRMMLRAAQQVARRLQAVAVVTGEAVGQVASQTLANLQVIDAASTGLVMRPLASWDKPDIIAMAHRIGVAELSETIPEYCGAISKNPTIKANLGKVEAEEKRCDQALLVQAVEQAVWYEVRDLWDVATAEQSGQASGLSAMLLHPGDIVIDVRTPDEAAAQPLRLAHNSVCCIPYYKIGSEFARLDASKTYFLYCERGLMSQLQAEHLVQRGFANVKVYHG